MKRELREMEEKFLAEKKKAAVSSSYILSILQGALLIQTRKPSKKPPTIIFAR